MLPLQDYLAAALPSAARWQMWHTWQTWRIARVGGGANNLLYHVSGPAGDLAVKFTLRDARDRAGREYAALGALRQAGLPLAPAPVLLDRERYAQPVVVQGWLDGAVAATPPVDDEGWRALIGHFAALHAVTPSRVAVPLRPAVLTMASAHAGLQSIGEQLARIPPSEQPAAVREVVDWAVRRPWPEWPAPPLALCRCDPNPTNFVRRRHEWASVDWENSGWGDPAFELADLMAHPAYLEVATARWQWVVETYGALRAGEAVLATGDTDPTFRARVRAYHRLLLVWWVVRLARALYEVPRGLDQRLAARPATWHAETEAKLDRYLDRAHEALADDPGEAAV